MTTDTTTRDLLKSYFQYGDTPTEAQFADLINKLATVVELQAEEDARIAADTAETSARVAADNALDAKITSNDAEFSAIHALLGTLSLAQNLGTFTGGTIPDSSTVKSALQSIETYIETLATSATVSGHNSRIASLEANIGLDSFTFACSAEIGNVSTGTVCTFRMPYDYSLVDVRGALTSASSSGNTSFTVAVNGSNVTNQIDLGVGSKTTYSAGAASSLVGINSSPIGITMDSEITVSVSSAGTGASGLKVTLVGSLGTTTITSSDGNITFPITFPYGTTLTTIS
ncbi:MAG: hypothetical protein Unbinned3806contig1000_31 [Prokaryotic dsDNA virus sp.]|nr:MAG: hypothetical protein Unbinned3806contig1000_31 [Prokaryotic dsDNA virus sp.]|tara:strand:- start:37115 stop:37975 length:861 start_codon:yes stop_codon:yes gene_type:complete